jgi:hypothetical protein
MAFNFLVFGLLGAMNSRFYQLQAHWFGASRSPPILATKTFVDQFLYTPFLSNPMQTLAFLWKSEQFSFRQTLQKMQLSAYSLGARQGDSGQNGKAVCRPQPSVLSPK